MNKQISKYTTRCPDSIWIEELYEKGLDLGSKDGSFLGISIGCNKGIDAINTARMGMKNLFFDKPKWVERLVTRGVNPNGSCHQQVNPQYTLKTTEKPRKGEMHCVEPTPV